MTDYDYTKQLYDLKNRVGQYSKLPNENKNVFASVSSSMPKINTQSPFFYAVPPIIIIVILFFTKPNFCCTDVIDIDNNITKKVNYTNIFITGLIFGGMISIGLFAYFKKNNINK